MKFKVIVEMATRVGNELEIDAETNEISSGVKTEAKAIKNARKGFQGVLAKTVDALGERPKTLAELAEAQCADTLVFGFVEKFHAAVLAELGKCEFLDSGNDKYVYGSSLSKASNLFLRELRYQINEVSKNALRFRSADVEFTPQMMDRLKFDQEAAQTEANFKAKLPSHPAFSADVLKKVEGKVGGEKVSETREEYLALMAKMRAEGKIQ